ncbi:UNVERIFIED_CONTAM: R3H domain-containing protein [Hammondia hammondi]|eukprot:XP_008882361.1 R3H domain-containing protein [Hammondia hammondi]
MSSLDRLVDLHRKLLQIEHAAETEELESALKTLSLTELEAQGVVLPRLVIHQVRSGLHSRTLVDFCTKRAAQVFQERQKNQSEPSEEAEEAAAAAALLPPQHRFTPGDIVGVFEGPHALQTAGSGGALASGVVHKVHAQVLSVAFESDDWLGRPERADGAAQGGKGRHEDESRGIFHLALISSSVTIDRQLRALERLKNYAPNGPAQTLINLCFGSQQPQPLSHGPHPAKEATVSSEADLTGAAHREISDISDSSSFPISDSSTFPSSFSSSSLDLSGCGVSWFSPTLTESQKRAVLLGLRSRDLALIHGPPGTGKSTALLELLLQLASRGARVLACAPSNVAVDNLLERVAAFTKVNSNASLEASRLAGRLRRCVRLGHPARVDENLSRFCLESQVQRSEGAVLSREIRLELDRSLEMLRDRKKLERHMQHRQKQTRGSGPAGVGESSGLSSSTWASTWSQAKRELREEIQTLRRELRAFERRAVEEVLEQSPIVFATCVGSDNEALKQFFAPPGDSSGKPGRSGFDVVVIDEAAQASLRLLPLFVLVAVALEAVCWIPLLYGHRAVLAGDHCQLPPTIKSRKAENGGLGVTLFERQMHAQHGPRISQLLDTQFRMHRKIMGWSNEQFYHGALRAADSVASRLLEGKYPRLKDETEHRGKRGEANLGQRADSSLGTRAEGELETFATCVAPPFLWIDTAGVSWLEEDNQEGDRSLLRQASTNSTALKLHASKSNRGEAALLVKRLQDLVWNFGVKPEDICIITPYRQQVQLLRQYLREAAEAAPALASGKEEGEARECETDSLRASFAHIPVNTVDGFQGKEGEVVAISLVRSNRKHEVGFLKDVRRLNVAVTRAKCHLLIVGDSETIANADNEAEAESADGGERGGSACKEPRGDQKTEGGEGSEQVGVRSAREILRSLFHYASEKGEVRSALEFIDISEVPGAQERKPKSQALPAAHATRTPSEFPKALSGSGLEKSGKGLSKAAAKKRRQERKKLQGEGAGDGAAGSQVEGKGGQRRFGSDRAREKEETDSLEKKYRNILVQFVQQADQAARQSRSSPSYTFPASLTAYERKVVHTLATELGLSHVSLGEGGERKIVVGRGQKGEARAASTATYDEALAGPATVEAPGGSSGSSESDAEADERRNAEGRVVEGEREAGDEDTEISEEEKPVKPCSPLGKKKPKKKGEKEASGPEEKGKEDDFDALIDSLSKEDWTCGSPRCQASTKVLGRVCPFCRKRFCFSHSMPEIHGCGDAASAHARKNFRESVMRERRRDEAEKRTGTGSGNSIFLGKSYAGNSWAQTQSQKKLRDKIDQEKKKRLAKKKDEGAKK